MAKFFQGEALIHEDTIPMSRRHDVGQGLVLNSTNYRVVASEMKGDEEHVQVAQAEICTDCGGVKGSSKNVYACVCR